LSRRIALIAALVMVAFAARQYVHSAGAITYTQGWNLVGGPEGSLLRGAVGSMYTLQPGDTVYEEIASTTPLHAGWGYWAYFPNGGSIDLGTGSALYRVLPVPGQYVMVGNPGTAGDATIIGADVQTLDTIPLGHGAFVISSRLVTITVPAMFIPTPPPTASPAPTVLPPCRDSRPGQVIAGSDCRITSQTNPTARCRDGSFDYNLNLLTCSAGGGVAYYIPGIPSERAYGIDPLSPAPAATSTTGTTPTPSATAAVPAVASASATPSATSASTTATPNPFAGGGPAPR